MLLFLDFYLTRDIGLSHLLVEDDPMSWSIAMMEQPARARSCVDRLAVDVAQGLLLDVICI
jgi:hypothetical protein